MKEDGLRQLENGVCVVSFEAIQTAIPRRISISGISIGFKYTGQPESCLRCSSMEHKVKDCPYQKRRKTKGQHEEEGLRVDVSSERSPQPYQNESQGHQEPHNKSQESFTRGNVPNAGDSEVAKQCNEIVLGATAANNKLIEAGAALTTDQPTSNFSFWENQTNPMVVPMEDIQSNENCKASKQLPKQNLFEEFVAVLARQDQADFVLFSKSKISQATGLYLRWKQGPYEESTALELGMSAVTDKSVIRQWKTLTDISPATAKLVQLHERL
jgi:hypothetical protein